MIITIILINIDVTIIYHGYSLRKKKSFEFLPPLYHPSGRRHTLRSAANCRQATPALLFQALRRCVQDGLTQSQTGVQGTLGLLCSGGRAYTAWAGLVSFLVFFFCGCIT
jgi:hypothetical protein